MSEWVIWSTPPHIWHPVSAHILVPETRINCEAPSFRFLSTEGHMENYSSGSKPSKNKLKPKHVGENVSVRDEIKLLDLLVLTPRCEVKVESILQNKHKHKVSQSPPED